MVGPKAEQTARKALTGRIGGRKWLCSHHALGCTRKAPTNRLTFICTHMCVPTHVLTSMCLLKNLTCKWGGAQGKWETMFWLGKGKM